MNAPEEALTEAGALAKAIQLAAQCGLPKHWPESAQLLLRDAARLAELHQLIVSAVSIGYCVLSRERTERLGIDKN